LIFCSGLIRAAGICLAGPVWAGIARQERRCQPTLTVADSWPELTDGGLVESLVINASTGFPVAVRDADPGKPLYVTYYHTSRVTLADIEAGKF
jgi:hypothetical protein